MDRDRALERLELSDVTRRRRLGARLDQVARFPRAGRLDEIAVAMLAAFPETSAMLRLLRATDDAKFLITPQWMRIPARPAVLAIPVGVTVAEVVEDEVEAMISALHHQEDRSHRRTGQVAVLRLVREAAARTARYVDGQLPRPDEPAGPAPLVELDEALTACPESDAEDELRARVVAVLDPQADDRRRAELSPVVDVVLAALPEIRLGTEVRRRASETRATMVARWTERASTGVGPAEATWRAAVADHLRHLGRNVPALDNPSADPPFATGYTDTRTVVLRSLGSRADRFATPG